MSYCSSYSVCNSIKQSNGERFSILFHGNCIDGFCSAGIAAFYLQSHCNAEMTYHGISPSLPATWPSAESMAGTHILLLDVSVPQETRAAWMAAGAHCIHCIDHHETSKAHWAAEESPIDTRYCTAMQTYHFFYEDAVIPSWLEAVDRIDRWDHPTFEDRCFREYMLPMSKLPVQGRMMEALVAFQKFIEISEEFGAIQQIIESGRAALAKKDGELFQLLTARGVVVDLDARHLQAWGLGENWMGVRLYLLDNSEFSIDTHEAAHLVFEHHPMKPNVFINYRRSSWFDRESKKKKEKIIYYARSHMDRGINLTEGSILQGDTTCAGHAMFMDEPRCYPFLL